MSTAPGGAELVCTVDIGTSAIRASIYSATGTQLKTSRQSGAVGRDPATFDPETLWIRTATALADVTSGVPLGRLAAIGLAGHIGTVFADSQGRPLGPGLTWADNRGTGILARRYQRFGDLARRTGRHALAGCAPAAICWLRERQPAQAAAIRRILSPKDFVVARLCGEYATDWVSAAYTNAFAVHARQWDPELLEAAAIDPGIFPAVLPPSAQAGEVLPTAAALTGLPAGLPVITGGPDGTVGVLGASGTTRDVLTDVAGTTDLLARIVDAEEAEAPESAAINPYPKAGLYSIGGATGMTGGAVAWLAEMLGYPDVAAAQQALGEQMSQLPPGCDGLMVCPDLTGSRFPFWRPAQRASVHGLQVTHSRAHLMRAAAEAGGFVVRRGAEILDPPSKHRPPARLICGGGAATDDMAQLRADVLGRVIDRTVTSDLTSLGAAVLAAAGSGVHPGIAAAWKEMRPQARTFLPDRERAAAFDDVYRRWLAAEEQGWGGIQGWQ